MTTIGTEQRRAHGAAIRAVLLPAFAVVATACALTQGVGSVPGGVRAGHGIYQVRAVRLEPAAGMQAVRVTVRFSNDGSAWFDRTLSADNFRLLVGGVALAPSRAPSHSVAVGATVEDDVVFVLPPGTGGVVGLQVGRADVASGGPDYGTAVIPIDLASAAS